ncbi:hypothetical protein J6590_099255 [Homalodisca vitripennis]|nr:hypothetical protein J6590_099255 [Homalodisca vitripennis]
MMALYQLFACISKLSVSVCKEAVDKRDVAKVASSANITDFELTQDTKSFTITMNRNGPSTDPCGTPADCIPSETLGWYRNLSLDEVNSRSICRLDTPPHLFDTGLKNLLRLSASGAACVADEAPDSILMTCHAALHLLLAVAIKFSLNFFLA